MRLSIRPVAEEDCRLLWEWANEAEVRRASFRSAPIPWQEHVAWFRRQQANPDCAMFLVVDDGRTPVAQVRVEAGRDGRAVVSLSVGKAFRGRGIGALALPLGCEQALARFPQIRAFVARIKPHNVPSIRLFESAGFVAAGGVWVRPVLHACADSR